MTELPDERDQTACRDERHFIVIAQSTRFNFTIYNGLKPVATNRPSANGGLNASTGS
jgi:hypothetical protein